jgi:hypothetical protein
MTSAIDWSDGIHIREFLVISFLRDAVGEIHSYFTLSASFMIVTPNWAKWIVSHFVEIIAQMHDAKNILPMTSPLDWSHNIHIRKINPQTFHSLDIYLLYRKYFLHSILFCC